MVTFSLSQYLNNASGKSQEKAFEDILAGTSKSLAEAEFLKHMLLLEISTTRDVFSRGRKVKKNPWCGAVKEFTKMYHGSDPFYDRLQEDFAGAGRELPFLIVGSAVIVRKYSLFVPVEYAVPFEFTPMYCGIPINPKDSIPGASSHLLPTGFVSPDGFNSKPVAHTPASNVITVDTEKPAQFSDVAGTTDM